MSGFRTAYGTLAQAPSPVTAELAGGPIQFFDGGGAGAAVLCLHGGMGGWDQSLLLGRAVLTPPSGYRVIAVSRPGYLGTPLSSGATPELQADAFAGLLDRLGSSGHGSPLCRRAAPPRCTLPCVTQAGAAG